MGTALGNMLSDLMHRLARQDADLRALAKYYARSGMASGGLAQAMLWYSDVLSTKVRQTLRRRVAEAEEWSEWHCRL